MADSRRPLIADVVIGLDGNLRLELRAELAEVAEENPEVLKGRVRYEERPRPEGMRRGVTAVMVKARTIGKAYLTRKANVTATGELQIEIHLPRIVIETEIVESPVPGKVKR